MNFIRKWIADKVVYQSDYVRQVWDDGYGKINHSLIIHNGSRVIEDKNIIQSNEYVHIPLKEQFKMIILRKI